MWTVAAGWMTSRWVMPIAVSTLEFGIGATPESSNWPLPSRHVDHHNVGRALYETGRVDEAYALMEEAVARWPGQARLRHLHGLLALRQGRPDEAVEDFRLLVDQSPDDPALLYQLAVALTAAAQWEAAESALAELRRRGHGEEFPIEEILQAIRSQRQSEP